MKGFRFIALGCFALAFLLGALGAWSMGSRISGAIILTGQLQTKSAAHPVQHLFGGRVAEVLVQEGDNVAAGQTLLRLETQLQISKVQFLSNRLASIYAEELRQIAEKDGSESLIVGKLSALTPVAPEDPRSQQQTLFEVRRTSHLNQLKLLNIQVGQVEAQLAGIAVQKTAVLAGIKLIASDLRADQTLFEKGLSQASRISSKKRELVRLKGDLGAFESQHILLLKQISHLKLEKLRLGIKRKENAMQRLQVLHSEKLALLEQLETAKLNVERRDLHAPIAGVVHNLSVTAPGTIIPPSQTILFVVPQGGIMVVSAKIRPADIDQVYQNQPAFLRFSSLERTTTPEVSASVSFVSAEALSEHPSQDALFNIELKVNQTELEAINVARLKSGTPVEVFVQTDQRSPLSYLMKPLTDYFKRAYRES